MSVNSGTTTTTSQTRAPYNEKDDITLGSRRLTQAICWVWRCRVVLRCGRAVSQYQVEEAAKHSTVGGLLRAVLRASCSQSLLAVVSVTMPAQFRGMDMLASKHSIGCQVAASRCAYDLLRHAYITASSFRPHSGWSRVRCTGRQ